MTSNITTGKGYSNKKCTKCFKIKSLESFNYVTSKKLKRRSICIECVKKYKENEEYKEKQRTYAKKRRTHENQREIEAKYRKKYLESLEGRVATLYNAAKQRSNQKGTEFEISKARIWIALKIGVCERTGIPFDFTLPNDTNFNPFTPSIDKINSKKGYTNDNIQIVCTVYNLGKGEMSDEQFIEFCRIAVRKYDERSRG